MKKTLFVSLSILVLVLGCSGRSKVETKGQAKCSADTDCASGYYCSDDKKCLLLDVSDPCTSNIECEAGDVCSGGKCVEVVCSLDSDCGNDGLVCRNGQCVSKISSKEEITLSCPPEVAASCDKEFTASVSTKNDGEYNWNVDDVFAVVISGDTKTATLRTSFDCLPQEVSNKYNVVACLKKEPSNCGSCEISVKVNAESNGGNQLVGGKFTLKPLPLGGLKDKLPLFKGSNADRFASVSGKLSPDGDSNGNPDPDTNNNVNPDSSISSRNEKQTCESLKPILFQGDYEIKPVNGVYKFGPHLSRTEVRFQLASLKDSPIKPANMTFEWRSNGVSYKKMLNYNKFALKKRYFHAETSRFRAMGRFQAAAHLSDNIHEMAPRPTEGHQAEDEFDAEATADEWDEDYSSQWDSEWDEDWESEYSDAEEGIELAWQEYETASDAWDKAEAELYAAKKEAKALDDKYSAEIVGVDDEEFEKIGEKWNPYFEEALAKVEAAKQKVSEAEQAFTEAKIKYDNKVAEYDSSELENAYDAELIAKYELKNAREDYEAAVEKEKELAKEIEALEKASSEFAAQADKYLKDPEYGADSLEYQTAMQIASEKARKIKELSAEHGKQVDKILTGKTKLDEAQKQYDAAADALYAELQKASSGKQVDSQKLKEEIAALSPSDRNALAIYNKEAAKITNDSIERSKKFLEELLANPEAQKQKDFALMVQSKKDFIEYLSSFKPFIGVDNGLGFMVAYGKAYQKEYDKLLNFFGDDLKKPEDAQEISSSLSKIADVAAEKMRSYPAKQYYQDFVNYSEPKPENDGSIYGRLQLTGAKQNADVFLSVRGSYAGEQCKWDYDIRVPVVFPSITSQSAKYLKRVIVDFGAVSGAEDNSHVFIALIGKDEKGKDVELAYSEKANFIKDRIAGDVVDFTKWKGPDSKNFVPIANLGIDVNKISRVEYRVYNCSGSGCGDDLKFNIDNAYLLTDYYYSQVAFKKKAKDGKVSGGYWKTSGKWMTIKHYFDEAAYAAEKDKDHSVFKQHWRKRKNVSGSDVLDSTIYRKFIYGDYLKITKII